MNLQSSCLRMCRRMFVSFFHQLPPATRWSFLFHQPFVELCIYSYRNQVSPIVSLADCRCRDETTYGYPIHDLLLLPFSSQPGAPCNPENSQINKKCLLDLTNPATEWHYQDEHSMHHHKSIRLPISFHSRPARKNIKWR